MLHFYCLQSLKNEYAYERMNDLQQFYIFHRDNEEWLTDALNFVKFVNQLCYNYLCIYTYYFTLESMIANKPANAEGKTNRLTDWLTDTPTVRQTHTQSKTYTKCKICDHLFFSVNVLTNLSITTDTVLGWRYWNVRDTNISIRWNRITFGIARTYFCWIWW